MTAGNISVVIPEEYKEQIPEDVLNSAVKAVLLENSLPDSTSITILITDNDQIQDLNQRYRGLDKPTDVLAFESDFTDPDLEARYLGDVVISFPQAKTQAESRGHEVTAELQLLVIHGVLHLLGYDHDTEARKSQMWSIQTTILEKLGNPIDIEEE
jgi:probable rRNA maturation factor